MQLADNNECTVVRRPQAEDKGIEEMPVGEAVSLASVGKWLVGLVLAPWLWHERKRVDKLTEALAQSHFTKEETKEQIKDKTHTLHRDVTEVKDTMKIMSENIVSMGVTMARIDERSKKDNG